MTEDDAKAALSARVSRETFEKLSIYAELLRKWQKSINLVSPSTIPTIWSRHILDSAQVYDAAPSQAKRWVDLGTGGGFPGLVCAIIAAEQNPDTQFTFIESDQRKSTFLRQMCRATETRATIQSHRIEDVPGQGADVISARALAALPQLLALAHPHMAEGAIALFQKGARYREELASAEADWQMNVEVLPSQTAPDSVILKITRLTHVTP